MKKTTQTNLLNKLKDQSRLTVIFQITDNCVLSCKYCFAKNSYSKNNNKGLIDTEILDRKSVV